MKKILSIFVVFIMVFTLAGCAKESAKTATENTLGAVKNLDLKTLTKYIGSDKLQKGFDEATSSQNKVDAKTMKEALPLLVKNYSYKIIDVKEDKDTATAKVEITNTDMQKVIGSDITEILKQSITNALKPSSDSSKLTDTQIADNTTKMILDSLKKDGVPITTSTVDITLKNVNGVWQVQPSDDLINAVSGGLLTIYKSLSDLSNSISSNN